MSTHTLSEQMVNVMQILSSVPGGERVELISRKYPNRTPWGDLSSFEQRTYIYAMTELSDFSLPKDTEAVSLVLHGTLQIGQLDPASLAKDLLFENGLCVEWGYRTDIGKDGRFSLEVFPEDAWRPSEP